MPRPVHFEIVADQPQRAEKFYSDVFGWKMQKWEGGDYWMINTGPDDEPGINGGMTLKSSTMPTCNTIEVPSVDDYLQKIREAGGTIAAEKMAIPGVGWLAYFEDPEGNFFGIMEEDEAAV